MECDIRACRGCRVVDQPLGDVEVEGGANFPVLIAGTAANDATQTFNPTKQLQRPGLLLMGGVVYAAFGAHCDSSPYSGWVAGISTTRVTHDAVDCDVAGRGGGAGIWQAGGGLVSDGPGQIILSTGNGKVPAAPTPGKPHLPRSVRRWSG